MRLMDMCHRKKHREQNVSTDALDKSLQGTAQRLHAIDPRTEEQWYRLKKELEREESATSVVKKSGGVFILRPALAVPVVAIVVAGLALVWFLQPTITRYDTARGQQETITLNDSTDIILNHTSELTVTQVPFERTRRVRLKGEAFFHVRRNGTPFIVSTDVGSVAVFGTEFNVRVRDGRLQVGVVQGRVQVNDVVDGKEAGMVLGAGQILSCTDNKVPDQPAAIPFSGYPGWTQGRMMFYRTELASVCKELESQFDILIEIRKPALKSTTITGTLDGHNLATAFATLAQLTGSSCRREGNTYILY